MILLFLKFDSFLSCLSAKIAAGAVVCVESEIKGDVTIGKTMIPSAWLRSSSLVFAYFLVCDHSRSVAVTGAKLPSVWSCLFPPCSKQVHLGELLALHC